MMAAEAAVPVAPDPSRRGSLRRLMRLLSRSCLIWRCAAKQLIKVAIVKRRYKRSAVTDPDLIAARRQLAVDLRDTLIRLGPTFIKVGQLLSTRIDVLPVEVIQELARLQNDVPGFPAKRAKAIIAEELGAPVEELFKDFTDVPLAAASLAQVHRATLKDGREVVVKVQRENLRELFDIDLLNIDLVARLADRLDPATEAIGANWKGIADTSGGVLYREIDFEIERRAAEEFGNNFKDFKSVKVPAMLPEFCSKRLLCMEYCPGVKISDTAELEKQGFDQVHISNTLTTSYLEQLCRHGFFHCDPHPGNLAVDNGYPGGRVVYYDFGMMERVEPAVRKGFVELIFSIYRTLPREACDALEVMGVLRPGVDRFSIERIAAELLKSFASTLANAENKWENQMTPEQKKASRRKRRAKIGADLFATQAERPLLLPPKFTFVFRAITTIDGIGKSLDAQYDLARISQPYLRELADLKDGSKFKTAAIELAERVGLRPIDLKAVVKQPRNVAAMEGTIKKLEAGDLKLRVRTLEVERMLEKSEFRQRLYGAALGAGLLYQIATTAAAAAAAATGTSALSRFVSTNVNRALYLGVGWLLYEARCAYLGLQSLSVQAARFSNTGDGRYDDQDFLVDQSSTIDEDDGILLGEGGAPLPLS